MNDSMQIRIPHAGGGEPSFIAARLAAPAVFPTQVGVNRSAAPIGTGSRGIPHAGGGEPTSLCETLCLWAYSPRRWG